MKAIKLSGALTIAVAATKLNHFDATRVASQFTQNSCSEVAGFWPICQADNWSHFEGLMVDGVATTSAEQ